MKFFTATTHTVKPLGAAKLVVLSSRFASARVDAETVNFETNRFKRSQQNFFVPVVGNKELFVTKPHSNVLTQVPVLKPI